MKKLRKIVLAGASGQIGTALSRYFAPKAEEIIILSRKAKASQANIRTVLWDGKTAGHWYSELEGTELLVNLAGKNVNCRYNEKNKKEIFDSRTNSIMALADAIKRCKNKPALWIQCASATIYRHAEDRPMTEESGEIGEGFSVEVCKLWENTFWQQSKVFEDIRKVVLRTSLVLGKEGGVLPRLKALARFGLGGRQGNGRQWVSWIHEEDVAAIVEWIINHEEMQGTYNCTAPEPLKNGDFMRELRKALKIALGLPAPAWLLELGALLIGTETELVLKSRWVLPERLLESGYEFRFPELKVAVEDLGRK